MSGKELWRARLWIISLLLAALVIAFPSCVETPSARRVTHFLLGDETQKVPAPQMAEVAFSPHGGGTDLILRVIASASREIRVAAYSFTSRPIGRALVAAHQAGVDVKVVADHSQIGKSSHSIIDDLAAGGVGVRIDTLHAIQHNKYMIVDGKTVQTGSFNYTASAESRNSENVLVFWDSPKLAETYAKDWLRLWNGAVSYKAK